MNSKLRYFIFGILIGASIMIPGLSGGTTAVILGVYFTIFDAINNLTKKFVSSAAIILPIIIGAVTGIILVSRPIAYLYNNFSLFFSYFILGVITGSTMPFKKVLKTYKIKSVLFVLIGILFVLSFESISRVLASSEFEIINYVIIGLISAIALILPGISLSNALIAFGCYDDVIQALNTFDIAYLMKLFISVAIGSLIISHTLTSVYKKYPISINLMILGMIIASINQIFIRIPDFVELLPCLLLYIFGFIIVAYIARFSENTDVT